MIAFPKSGGGYDPLTGAPAPITSQQRREAGVDAALERSTSLRQNRYLVRRGNHLTVI